MRDGEELLGLVPELLAEGERGEHGREEDVGGGGEDLQPDLRAAAPVIAVDGPAAAEVLGDASAEPDAALDLASPSAPVFQSGALLPSGISPAMVDHWSGSGASEGYGCGRSPRRLLAARAKGMNAFPTNTFYEWLSLFLSATVRKCSLSKCVQIRNNRLLTGNFPETRMKTRCALLVQLFFSSKASKAS